MSILPPQGRDCEPVRHQQVVPPLAGIAPYCTCGWPETEGGRSMVWRYGDKTLAEHLREVADA